MIERVFRGKTDSTFIQLFRYIFAGGMAFIVVFSSLFIFTEFLNIHYLISAALAYLLGITTNYTVCIAWVFNKRRLGNKELEFGIFAFIGIIGLGLNELSIWFFTEHVNFHYLISQIVSAFVVFWWNFLAKKHVLFT